MKPSFQKKTKRTNEWEIKKKNRMGIIATLLCTSFLAVAATACGDGYSGNYREVTATDTAMGTIVVQRIYISDREERKSTATDGENAPDQEILSILNGMEAEELSWRMEGSEVFQINAQAGSPGGTELSDGLFRLLDTCLDVSEASEGAFDITIGDVARLWNIDAWASGSESGTYSLPRPEAIGEAINNTGYEKIELQDGRIFMPESMSIDLGAVGKGAALDRIMEYLESEPDLSGAVISVGGSVLTYETKPDGTSWNIGIVDPFDPSENLGVLTLTGTWCVSTSGDYERFVEVDGVRYHHIIDPGTGYPADSGVRSATIVTNDGALSDALSTACFILGGERGLALAEKYGAEALLVEGSGEISMTEGMKEIFRLSNP